MGDPVSIPKFFDSPRPPAPNGWHYWLDDAKAFPVNGASAAAVMKQIQTYRQNNRMPRSSEQEIYEELWAYWCSREPKRCKIIPGQPVNPETLPGKEMWGPIIWRFLNWAAVNYNGPFFTMLVNEMRTRLVICPDCAKHFGELLVKYPLTQVRDARSACAWTLAVHNAVNRSIGKPIFTAEQFRLQYGAPIL